MGSTHHSKSKRTRSIYVVSDVDVERLAAEAANIKELHNAAIDLPQNPLADKAVTKTAQEVLALGHASDSTVSQPNQVRRNRYFRHRV